MKKLLCFFKEVVLSLPLLAFSNILLLWMVLADLNLPIKLLLSAFLMICYLTALLRIYPKHAGSHRLAAISHGLQLLRYLAICLFLEPLVGIALAVTYPWSIRMPTALLIANFAVFAFFMLLMAFGGLLRLGIAARQVKWYWYLFLYLVWWMSPFNLIPLIYIYTTARREFYYETARMELDVERKENESCCTKYPVLMVHGIFFRDWQFFNYWGRIPKTLQRYGAKVYYGKQQSSQTVAVCAQELAEQIHAVLAETGAEKLNIIAHSKGGLDSRYAISELGIAPYVASLTTINTPHHGCAWVDHQLKTLPPSFVRCIARHYDRIFRKLGDKTPDFLGGVRDLTAERCKEFNEKYPIDPTIPHHCIMSEMRSFTAAPFPLSLGYLCNKRYDKTTRCDGLVPLESARLEGVPFTLIPRTKRRGISHADMIDLNRENIADFDVRDFYAKLLIDLKEKGL